MAGVVEEADDRARRLVLAIDAVDVNPHWPKCFWDSDSAASSCDSEVSSTGNLLEAQKAEAYRWSRTFGSHILT
jgi:hypothetical protein